MAISFSHRVSKIWGSSTASFEFDLNLKDASSNSAANRIAQWHPGQDAYHLDKIITFLPLKARLRVNEDEQLWDFLQDYQSWREQSRFPPTMAAIGFMVQEKRKALLTIKNISCEKLQEAIRRHETSVQLSCFQKPRPTKANTSNSQHSWFDG